MWWLHESIFGIGAMNVVGVGEVSGIRTMNVVDAEEVSVIGR